MLNPPPSSVANTDNLTAEEWLSNNIEIVERWIIEKTTLEFRRTLGEKLSKFCLSRKSSIASDIHQLFLGSSPIKSQKMLINKTQVEKKCLEALNESDLLMELIRDIANELDIDVLCHKILLNVQLLTNADRGSLFLVRETCGTKYLVAKLFDVQQDTKFEDVMQCAKNDAFEIPFGIGIAGIVAETKQVINIKNAYEDPRFNSEIDMKTGYKTNSILCMPICTYEEEVIGVAQIINKRSADQCFNDHDIEIFQKYLIFCGIGIQNAQLFEISVLEFKRNQILLNLARSIFEEQNNLECLVSKIMTEAQELLDCDRCAVYLLDLNCCEANHLENFSDKPSRDMTLVYEPLKRRQSNTLNAKEIKDNQVKVPCPFNTVFELKSSNGQPCLTKCQISEFKNPILLEIASYAAAVGYILNISDVPNWLNIKSENINEDTPKNLLNMPILNGKKSMIGVAQLINKMNNESFTESDVSLFEAFALFCGLGIHNTQMYENACKLMAQQKVALECLSYHATASNEATATLVNGSIPSTEHYNLYSFSFTDFHLSDADTCKAVIRMFQECNLIQQFHIPYEVLCRWILSVKKNYRPVKYHNWRHALNVAQTMFALLKTGKMDRFLSDLEILGLLVACLCHDLDHRGTNNAFQMKTESPLAILYTTSTMEHHHFDQCVMILNSDVNNIFQALSPEDYRKVMKIVESAILSTDLAMFFKKRSKFLELIENGEFDWQRPDKKELLCGMMMTACDVSAISKPWEVQHKVAKLVADEFFEQGDLEKMQLKEQPIAMMDRERKDELPHMQVNFIDKICLPLYKILSETFPWVKPLYEGTLDNRNRWQDLAEKVEMGLTWIDHDEIETLDDIDSKNNEIELIVTTFQSTTKEHTQQPTEFPSLEPDAVLKTQQFKEKIRKKRCMIL